MARPAVQDQIVGLETRDAARLERWTIIVALAIGIALITIIFLKEIRAAVEVWNASTAYSHCYLVLPMALYLLWERRDLLAQSRAEPELVFAILAVPLTLFWLVAERLGVMEARQLAVIAGVELLFLTVLGRRLYWRMSGPLMFLIFLVPFGAFLTPALQQFTATFSILGLDLLGIPNFSDKFMIETPAGIFFVAEACAGLRFLIAAIAFGVFYSLLSYTSLTRRLAFIAASVIVPIIANGFRALGIVVLGQVLGSAQAAAADHIIYGWVFFSTVMLLLIAGGHAFRESIPSSVAALPSRPPLPKRSAILCVIATILLLGLGPAVAGAIDLRASAPALAELPTIVAPPGCAATDGGTERSVSRQRFSIACNGIRFEVVVEAFAARSTSSAMIAERRRVTQEIGAENSAVSVVDIPGGAGYWTVVQTTDPDRVTAYASWVDGSHVTSGTAARIAQAYDSVFGSAFAPTLITITTAEPSASSPSQRKQTLETLIDLLRGQTGLDSRMSALTRAAGS